MDVTIFEVRHGETRLEAAGENEFWQAWALPDAKVPAVLAAKYSMVLFTVDAAGSAKARVVAPFDDHGASWQWLDADAGQPGEKHWVGFGDWRDEQRALAGGHLLLLADRFVLDLASLETQWIGRIRGHSELREPSSHRVNETSAYGSYVNRACRRRRSPRSEPRRPENPRSSTCRRKSRQPYVERPVEERRMPNGTA